ncbi:MAG TPA: hypothetical protein VGC71_10285 [Gaiellales bacterium]
MGSFGLAARAAIMGCLVALVLGVAYVIVQNGDSRPTIRPVVRTPPVTATVASPTELGTGRAAMASGRAGLWVVRQPPNRSHGQLIQFRMPDGEAQQPIALDLSPVSVAVGARDVWVLGTRRASTLAVLERIDPSTGRVRARAALAEAPACLTRAFASCYPVVTRHGVWVPLSDTVVRVEPSGKMADRNVQVEGHLWDVTSDGGRWVWAIAEVGLYRIDERTGHMRRWALRDLLHDGLLQPNHIVANEKAVWISCFPRRGNRPRGQLIHVVPGRDPTIPQTPRLYPGAGSLALVGGGLWLDRYDGEGELDRLSQLTGDLTGPFVSVPDDVVAIAPRAGDLWLLSYQPDGNKRTVTKVDLSPASSG